MSMLARSPRKFAQLPLRAICDQRLKTIHFRALGLVAWHSHRHDKCWAGYQKMADKIGCHYANLKAAISDLIAWGYVTSEASHDDKRLRVLRVVHDVLSPFGNDATTKVGSKGGYRSRKVGSKGDYRSARAKQQNISDDQALNSNSEARNRDYEIVDRIEAINGARPDGRDANVSKEAIDEASKQRRSNWSVTSLSQEAAKELTGIGKRGRGLGNGSVTQLSEPGKHSFRSETMLSEPAAQTPSGGGARKKWGNGSVTPSLSAKAAQAKAIVSGLKQLSEPAAQTLTSIGTGK